MAGDRSRKTPILNTDKLFLKRGEKIHYIDKAINLEIKTVKQYRHVGHSTPGLLKGNRWNVGGKAYRAYRVKISSGNFICYESKNCISGIRVGI